MKTSELIAALGADPVPEPIRLGRRVAAALAIGVVASFALYLLLLGPRPDIDEAMRTMRFGLKFVDCVGLRPAVAAADAAPRAPRREAGSARALADRAVRSARRAA